MAFICQIGAEETKSQQLQTRQKKINKSMPKITFFLGNNGE